MSINAPLPCERSNAAHTWLDGRPRRTLVAVWLAVSLGASTACGGGTQLLGGRLDGGGAGGGAGGGTSGSGGAGGADAEVADLAEAGTDGPEADEPADAPGDQVCGTAGSVVTIPTARGEVCTGAIANQAFRFALCTCTELGWQGDLRTDSFDSRTGQTGLNNAAVGVDGYVLTPHPYHVGGSFWIASAPPIAPSLSVVTSAACDVAKELRVGGAIAGQGPQTVGGDLFSAGNVTCLGMRIGGAIHVPAGRMVTGATATKGIVREPVTVAKPCDCAAPAVDTAAVVDVFSQKHDDAASGIAPTDLTAFVGPKTLDLGCGRFHFQEISGRDLTLRVHGRAAISVAGDVTVAGQFTIELAAAEDELDLFVRGDLKLTGATSFGNPAGPARFRVYVAGGSVALPTGVPIGANIYAPASLVSSGGPIEMSGALFANRVSFGGTVTVHYDQAILGGRGCLEPPSGAACATCRDCGAAAPACRLGACTACATSADCCPPLVCDGAGRCVPPDALMTRAP